MRWIFRIILFPLSLVISLITAFLSFLLGIGTVLLNILSGIMIAISLYSLFTKEYTIAIEGIVVAFILSPYGLPMVGAFVIALLSKINNRIRAI